MRSPPSGTTCSNRYNDHDHYRFTDRCSRRADMSGVTTAEFTTEGNADFVASRPPESFIRQQYTIVLETAVYKSLARLLLLLLLLHYWRRWSLPAITSKQKSPRMVPGALASGLVSPSILRPIATTSLPSQAMQTTGPEIM